MINTIHNNAKEKGFWQEPIDANFILAKMCLIHSEVSEVMEAYRKQMGSDKILEEFADIFIRTYDLIAGMAEQGIIDHSDINKIITQKMLTNAQRPKLHGNLI
jgi:NTP pyrophosphatase (non-canonical NTP hydrolase)